MINCTISCFIKFLCLNNYNKEKQGEKEKNKERENAWVKIETLAHQNPNFNDLEIEALVTNFDEGKNNYNYTVDEDVVDNNFGDNLQLENQETQSGVNKFNSVRKKSTPPKVSSPLKSIDHKVKDEYHNLQSDESSNNT